MEVVPGAGILPTCPDAIQKQDGGGDRHAIELLLQNILFLVHVYYTADQLICLLDLNIHIYLYML